MMNRLFSIFYNQKKEKAAAAVSSLQEEIKKLGAETVKEKISRRTDIVLAVGGDGTLLRTGREAVEYEKPVVYINVGTLGFLGSPPKNFSSFVRKIFSTELTTEKRMLLEARAENEKFTALNDIVVKNGATARVIELQLSVDGQHLGNLKGDGVIVSTPTGSTAYCLAAGGPVLVPELEAIVISPLNPHSLNNRSIVVSSDSEITVRCPASQGSEIILTADGQCSRKLNPPEVVKIKKHPRYLELAADGTSFFKALSDKMNWGVRSGKEIRNGD